MPKLRLLAPAMLLMAMTVACKPVTTSVQSTALQPIALAPTEESRPVAFRGLAFHLPRGSSFGTISAGLFCLPYQELTARGRQAVPIERFEDVFRAELSDANYRVVGDPSDLFGSVGTEQAEYLIAGAITEMELNICHPNVRYATTRGSGAAYMSIEWQVFDAYRREVVLKVQTSGHGEATDIERVSDFVTDEAFAMATRNLLADERFSTLLSDGAVAHPAAAPPDVEATLRYERNPGLGEGYLASNTAVVRTGSGHGSGFLLDSALLVTSQHVVGSAERVQVRFVDGYETEGEVAYADPVRDLALIRLTRPGATGLSLATTLPGSGAEVFSYGAPLDESLAGTLRRGVVSGLREHRGQSFLQADAPIDPGNSGGPLFDRRGNVVGVATWLIVTESGPQGINYFVPITDVTALVGVRH